MKYIYTVIEADNLSLLIDKVNIAMRDGWRSEGGICCVQFQTRPDGLASYRFMQAMGRGAGKSQLAAARMTPPPGKTWTPMSVRPVANRQILLKWESDNGDVPIFAIGETDVDDNGETIVDWSENIIREPDCWKNIE